MAYPRIIYSTDEIYTRGENPSTSKIFKKAKEETGRDKIAIAVRITRSVLRPRWMTERLHIYFDKTMSRSDGHDAAEETEIRAGPPSWDAGNSSARRRTRPTMYVLRPSGS